MVLLTDDHDEVGIPLPLGGHGQEIDEHGLLLSHV